ncbi:MAG: AbrB/MazE/SpoVT family DNA-binding domain-containing protein [Candidatus Aenigmarchaeota archaeon]|nr:AbrB/MazE/SpoVT family DNA-binding domain-containing protein [Candidatus Aenigmarchaeota archaeon]
MVKIRVERRVFKFGGSLAVTLPSLFVKVNELRKGDLVVIEGDLKKLKIKKAGGGNALTNPTM